MTTKFKDGTSRHKKTLFHTYAFAVNATEIGVWGAAYITTSVATDLSVDTFVRAGAKTLAVYFIPAAPLYTMIKNTDRAVATGKQLVRGGSFVYKSARYFTSQIEFVNYISTKALTKYGATEALKSLCNVEECDAFYWERPENPYRN